MGTEKTQESRGGALPCSLCREDLISRSAKTRNWLVGLLVVLGIAGANEVRMIENKIDGCADASEISELHVTLKDILKSQAAIQTDVAIIKTKQASGLEDIRDEIDRSKGEDKEIHGELDELDDRMRRVEP